MATSSNYLEQVASAQDVLRKAFESRSNRLHRPQSEPQQLAPQQQAQAALNQGHFHGDGHDHGTPGGSDDDLLSAQFNTSLQKMLGALGGKVTVTSQKRDSKRQKQLWEQALKKYGSPEKARKWVAPPGGSYHEKGTHGLAADLRFADDATRAQVHKLAAQYGLWFPLANEPWHIEPISTKKRRGRG